jgi:hypothetical protein
MRALLSLCLLSLLCAGCVAVPVRGPAYYGPPAYYAAPAPVVVAPYPWYHRRW